jgi:hypothetical protein
MSLAEFFARAPRVLDDAPPTPPSTPPPDAAAEREVEEFRAKYKPPAACGWCSNGSLGVGRRPDGRLTWFCPRCGRAVQASVSLEEHKRREAEATEAWRKSQEPPLPPPSPEDLRRALAEAITQRTEAQCVAAKLQQDAAAAALAVSDAYAARDTAERDLAEAQNHAVDAAVVDIRAGKRPAVMSAEAARQAQRDAEDSLAAAETARAAIYSELSAAQREVERAEGKVRECACAVLARELGEAIVARTAKARAEYIACCEQLDGMRKIGVRVSAASELLAEFDRNHLPPPDPLGLAKPPAARAAIRVILAALCRDADATLIA